MEYTEHPVYRILSIHGFFGPDDTLHVEGEEIEYDGVPNEEMEPLNEPARLKVREYLEYLDKLSEETAKKFDRPFVGRPRDLDGAITLARADEQARLRIMGADKVNPTHIEKVQKEEVPETGQKKGRGRPRKLAIQAA